MTDSWLDLAADDPFGVATLPYGVPSLPGLGPQVAVRIGDQALPLGPVTQSLLGERARLFARAEPGRVPGRRAGGLGRGPGRAHRVVHRPALPRADRAAAGADRRAAH